MGAMYEYGIRIKLDGNRAAAQGIDGITTSATGLGNAFKAAGEKVVVGQQSVATSTAQLATSQVKFTDSVRGVTSAATQSKNSLTQVSTAAAQAGAAIAAAGQRAAASSKVVAESTGTMTSQQNRFIESLKSQAATLGMGRTQILAYQAAELGLTKETEHLIAKMRQFDEAAKASAAAATKAAEATAEATRKTTDRANQLSGAVKLLVAGYAAFKVADFVKDAGLLNARYESLAGTLYVVGQNAGYTKTQLDAAARGLQESGISMIESRQQTVRLVQAHIDLADAQKLARIAQDAARIGNINSSEAFAQMIHGIQTGQTDVLRTIGLNISMEQSYASYARQLNKNKDELTQNERTQAVVNATMLAGADIAGAYANSMDSASKQIASMTRYVEDLKVSVGEVFNEVLTVAVMGWTEHLKDSNKEVSELAKNGELKAWGHDLAVMFVGIANSIDNMVTGIKMLGNAAGRQAAGAEINKRFDRDVSDFKPGVSVSDAINAREKRRAAAFEEEAKRYEAAQVQLGGMVDRFDRAFEERTRARDAKAAAEGRSIVDREKQLTDLLAFYQSERAKGMLSEADYLRSVKDVNQAFKGDNHKYKDTGGTGAGGPKVDQAANTEMADKLARLAGLATAQREHYEELKRLDDMYHSAGELSDQQYYDRKRDFADKVAASAVDAFDKEIAVLRAHKNKTVEEEKRTQKQINDILDKKAAADVRRAADNFRFEEEERLRNKAMLASSDEAINKYIASLEREAEKLEDNNQAHEESKDAVQREEIARLALAIAAQKQFIEIQSIAGATAEELAQAPAILKFLEDQKAARERIAKALADSSVIAANKKAAQTAAQDWESTAQTIRTSLADAIANGGGSAWKKLKADIVGRVLNVPINMASNYAASILNPGAAQSQAGGGGLGGISNMLSTGSALYSTVTATGSGSIGAWMAGSSAVAPTSVFAANAAGAVGGDALGTLIAAEGWSAAAGGASAAAAGTGAAAAGTGAAGSAATTGIMGSATAALAAIPVWGWAVLAVAAIAAYISSGQGPEENTRLNFTSNNTPGNISINERGNEGRTWQSYVDGHGTSAFGTFGINSTYWMNAAQPAVQQFIKAVSATDDVLATFLTNAERSSVTQYLTGKTTIAQTGHQDGNPNGTGELDRVFSQRITWIMDGVESGLSNLVAGFKGTSQELASEAGAILEYRRALVSASESMFGAKVTLMEIAALKGETEATSVALARVTQVFAVTNKVAEVLGKTGSEAFHIVGLASMAARQQLINTAGGLEKLVAATSFFEENFLTEAEKAAPLIKNVAAAMAALGFAGVDTDKEFREAVMGYKDSSGKMVGGIDVSTEAGAKLYVELMKIAPQFKQMTELSIKLGLAVGGTGEIMKSLEDQQSDARSALKEAYDAEANALQGVIDKTGAWGQSLKTFRDSQLLGSQSPLTPAQKYSEAKAQYDRTVVAARGGDETARANFQSALTAFLSASQAANASDAQYQSDFARTQHDLAEAVKWASVEVDVAKASLTALNLQVAGLMTVNQSVLTVSEAVRALTAVLGANGGASQAGASTAAIESLYQSLLGRQSDQEGLKFWTNALTSGVSITQIASEFTESPEYKSLHGSHYGGIDRVPFNGYMMEGHRDEAVLRSGEASEYRKYGTGSAALETLATEIRRLNGANDLLTAEVKGLRADQVEHTGALLANNQDANEQAAERISDAVTMAAETKGWGAKSEAILS